MGPVRSAVALILSLVLATGCFGYNRSAKRWAYVGDAVLIAAGGATIALDVTSKDAPCMPDAMNNGCSYRSPIHGALVAGIVLAAAGVFGVLFNATRDTVKTSR
jgi:succinate dehydrogenase/fumarate reductase flavoprotein subunit